MTSDSTQQFEKRKQDHISVSLDSISQVEAGAGFDRISLIHEALPNIDFSEVSIETQLFEKTVKPLFISSMTAGHSRGVIINQSLALASQKHNWMMGVGSQRRELLDKESRREWIKVKEIAPEAKLIGNIGLTQVISSSTADIQELVKSLGAYAIFIHTNPVQEVLQAEGTPQFRGNLDAIKRLCESLTVPVILKETGCGFSKTTLDKLKGLGLYAVDVSGFGGTHWGRVEGYRLAPHHPLHMAAKTFSNWGITTVQSLISAKNAQPDYRIWASGGVRTGLDAAKCIALGADMVGIAQPIMAAAVKGLDEVNQVMEQFELTLRMSLFFTGCQSLKDLKKAEILISQ